MKSFHKNISKIPKVNYLTLFLCKIIVSDIFDMVDFLRFLSTHKVLILAKLRFTKLQDLTVDLSSMN